MNNKNAGVWIEIQYPGFLRSSKRRAAKIEARREERERGEKTFGCPRQLIDLTAPVDLNLVNI